MPFIDSHCHLNMLDVTDREGGIDDVLAKAKELGISHMLCVSVDLETYPDVLAYAKKYDHIFASVGQHPNDSEEGRADFDHLKKLAEDIDVVAIGETGLDYFRTTGEAALANQQQSFRMHIQVAKVVNKPLIIHTREARDDTIRILQEEGAADPKGVMHCFTETWEMAKQAMDLGFYISFSGIVTFKNAVELKEVAKKMPLDRMLIETDSPYLAPVPYRGKPNEPAFVRYVAEYLAELRNEPLEKIAEQTSENFFTLFSTAKRRNK